MTGLFGVISSGSGEGGSGEGLGARGRQAADRKPVPTIVVIGGIYVRRIEVQVTRVSITTVGSRGPVVAVAASIVERTIVVVAREQKQHSRCDVHMKKDAIVILEYPGGALYVKVVQLIFL